MVAERGRGREIEIEIELGCACHTVTTGEVLGSGQGNGKVRDTRRENGKVVCMLLLSVHSSPLPWTVCPQFVQLLLKKTRFSVEVLRNTSSILL